MHEVHRLAALAHLDAIGGGLATTLGFAGHGRARMFETTPVAATRLRWPSATPTAHRTRSDPRRKRTRRRPDPAGYWLSSPPPAGSSGRPENRRAKAGAGGTGRAATSSGIARNAPSGAGRANGRWTRSPPACVTPMSPGQGVSSAYRFFSPRTCETWCAPLAMCERTVALEQLRCGPLLQRQTLHVAQRSAPPAPWLKRRNPSSR